MRKFRYSSSPDDGNPPERIGSPRASKKLLLSASMAGLMIASAGAQGQTTEWTGAVSNDWMTPGNWTNGLPSAASGTARIDIPNEAVISGSAAEARSLNVGISNPASLSIINGGTLTNRGASIGVFGASNGSVNVTGPGSTWNLTNTLSVGEYGTGSLLVSDGGVVNNPAGLLVGLDSSSGVPGSGEVTVTGAGSLLTTNWPEIGVFGNGVLNILNGGRVETATDAYLAVTRSGIVNVNGSGSVFEIGGDMEIGWRGNGVAVVADSGLLDIAGAIVLAAHADGSGTLVIGAAAGEAAASPGVVNAAGIGFGPGDGRIVFNHTGANHLFAPGLFGNGRIDVIAGKTTLTGDMNGFSGEFHVSGGALSATNPLFGTLLISQTGRFSGPYVVGDVTVASGGTFAPGGPSATTLIYGDITFSPGSRYEVQVVPNSLVRNRITTTGKAILDGGAVVHVGEAGVYNPTMTRRILFASGGIEGTFDEALSDFAFLDPHLTYGATFVDLTLERNDVTFSMAASTDNQFATADALDTLSFGDPIHDAVVVLDAPQARSAFEQLSGEVHASATSTLISGSGAMRNVVEQRMRGTLGGGRTAGAIAAYASLEEAETAPSMEPATADNVLWGRAFGSWARIGGTAGISGVRHDEGGFLIGADRDLADAWTLPAAFDAFRVGAFAGYSRSTFNLDTQTASGASHNYRLGLYGNAQWGNLRLAGGVTHTLHQAGSVRRVSFPGLHETLTASYRAQTTQLFAEAGYRIGTGALAFEPFAGLGLVHFARDGYREDGGVTALTVSRGTKNSVFSTLGLRAYSDLQLGVLPVTARGMIGWRHALKSGRTSADVSLAGTGSFRTAGAPSERNMAIMEAGLDFGLSERTTLSLSYDGRLGARSSEHGINAKVRMNF